MGTVWEAITATSRLIWRSMVLQLATRFLLRWSYSAIRWCALRPMALVGGLAAMWLVNQIAAVPTTKVLLSFAFGDLGALLFNFSIIFVGVLVGAGVIELRWPDGRR